MTLTSRQLLVLRAMLKYNFRLPGLVEDEGAYLLALVQHVQSHDIAAAHELRVGRPQAEWTAADVEAFLQVMKAIPGPRDTFGPGVHRLHVVRDDGPYAVTDAELLELMGRGVDVLAELRREQPTKSLPIMASVLLTTGAILSTAVGRGDRIAVLKLLAQMQPVFGFFIVFDAFVHGVDTGGANSKATKRDAIMANAGTRDWRVVRVRTYQVEGQAVRFDDPPRPDLDSRENTGWKMEDPYATIFVSVPAPAGPPS